MKQLVQAIPDPLPKLDRDARGRKNGAFAGAALRSPFWVLIVPLCWAASLFAEEPARVSPSSGHFAEQIFYFDRARPPIIEVFAWDEKEHWQLRWVYFDSDGDWDLDTSMHFWNEPKNLSEAEKEARRQRDKQFNAVRIHNVKFVPFDDTRKNIIRLYPQSSLYQALGADETFRFALSGSLRLLAPPLPADPKNFDLRESAGYQALLERLRKVKLSNPPPVPKNQ